VRHLCEDYWKSLVPNAKSATPSRAVDFVDCEGVVVTQNGPRSWILSLTSPSTELLLRTPTESPGFKRGDRIRLLDLALVRDDDSSGATLTMTQASEVYVLAGRP
jgi:hypothetical protein